MISHQEKCIFVHIPKAAGQSIESVFVSRAGLTWQQREKLLLKPNSKPECGPPRLAHLQASEYVSLGYITEALFKQYFSFSFVRNPWARLVSEYLYRKQHGDLVYQQEFKSFLFNSFPTPKADDYGKAKDYYRHVIPQWQFLYDDNDKCLVDYIGKFETLQQDFNHVCNALNIDQTQLPHKNSTPQSLANDGIIERALFKLYQRLQQLMAAKAKTKAPYTEFYDSESREFIAHYYQKDIALFNYHFEAEHELNFSPVSREGINA